MAPSAALRYAHTDATEGLVYLPPILQADATWVDVAADPVPLCIVAGELTAAALTAAKGGYITLGLGAAVDWFCRASALALPPSLAAFNWAARPVRLCFNSDVASRPRLMLALSRLVLLLTAHSASVSRLRWPDSVDTQPQTVVRYMREQGVKALADLIETAELTEPEVEFYRLNEEVALLWSGGAAGNLMRLADAQIMKPKTCTESFYSDRVYYEAVQSKNGGSSLVPRPAAPAWLKWPWKLRVRQITYAPGAPRITFDNDYNRYCPDGARPQKGDITPWLALLTHMFKDLPEEHMLWLKRWFAYPLQHPGTKLYTCVLLWSHAGGTGKNLLAETMIPIYGPSNCETVRSKHLTSDFNEWIEGKQYIIGDEISLDDKRQTTGDLKAMLSNEHVRINLKGVGAYKMPDCANYVLTSNDPVALSLEPGERRTFVHHVNETPLGALKGDQYAAWLRATGAAALAWYLTKELDLGEFSPHAPPPMTAARQDMINNSRSEVDAWAVALKDAPDALLAGPSAKFAGQTTPGPFNVYTSDELLRLYDPEERKRVGKRALGIALERAGFRKAADNNGRLPNGTRPQFWFVRGDNPNHPAVSGQRAAELYTAERGKTVRSAGVEKGARVQ